MAIPTLFLVHQSVSLSWNTDTNRKISRNILISISLFFGLILGHCYKEKLVSSLVTKEHEKPIDTIQDLLESGLKFYYPARTAFARALAIDPRAEIKQVMEHHAVGFPFFGDPPPWTIEM